MSDKWQAVFVALTTYCLLLTTYRGAFPIATDLPLDDRISIKALLIDFSSKSVAVAQFLAERLVYAAATLLLIIFLSFFGLEMARGADFSAAVSFGLTNSLDYLGRLLRWDLGTAFAAGFGSRRLEISDILSQTLPNSLGLLAISLGGAAIVGVLLGAAAASERGLFKYLSLPILLTSLVGISLPSFFVALLLQIGVIRITQFTGQTFIPVGGFGWDDHLILPALVLATRPIAQIARITSVTLANVWREDYVRTASSKGLGSDLVWLRHIWPNSAIPILTTIGTAIRFSLSSLPVVELYFGWTGIGLVLLRAISRQDDLLTVALALCLGAIFIVTNFILEASYRLLDPRLRDGNSSNVASAARPQSWGDRLRSLSSTIRALPFWRRWLNPKTEAELLYEERLRPQTTSPTKGQRDAGIRRERLKTWVRATLGSLPFMTGAFLLLGLVLIYVAGPALSPANPYNTKGIAKVEGIISVPPFAPSDTYPWGSDALGRDMMSLVFSGAQQTLTLIALVMVARLIVGFVLGTLAGWQQDRFLDRLIMSLNEVFAALPALIFAMILILALGIRRGIWVFVVALCFVGWGEMMQFIRSEVIVIRKQLFVESATALGSRLSGIVMRHMLPNLLPALISLAALEMGAIAILLGELGFIGIFIGGGTFTEVDIGGLPYHYSDVPEWGALLSNVRTFARSHPWTAFTPAAAFFMAIFAFNLFGEGLRRLVQDVGLSFNRLFNRYMVVVVVLVVFGLRWVEDNTGSTIFLRQQADLFSQAGAMAHFDYLTDPRLSGRAIGTGGAIETADYIAAQFEAYGLQPAGIKNTYFFDIKRDFFSLSQVPQLSVEGRPLVYREDFAEIPLNLFNANDRPKSGELVVLLVGDQVFGSRSFTGRNFPPEVTDLDLSNNAVLLLDNGGFLPDVERQGTFYLTRNPDDLTKRDSLSAYSPQAPAYIPLQGGPFYYLSVEGVDQLLADTGLSLSQLVEQEQSLEPNEIAIVPTGLTVASNMPGRLQTQVPAKHVIGYLPGLDENLDENLVVVLAQYDGLGQAADGQFYAGANQSASGVAVMLEMLRSWQEASYQPRKTLIFVAYVGEGFDYKQRPSRTPDVERFISAKFGFAASFTPEAFIFLDGVGAGTTDDLTLQAGGNLRLAQHFERSARRMGVNTQRANEAFNLSIIFGGGAGVAAEAAPTITVYWAGAQTLADTPADSPDRVTADKLEQAGKALSLAIATMAREVNY